MEQLKRLVQAVDDVQQRHRWLAFPVAVVKKYGEDQAGQRAALLAYYGFFSLFPLLLVAVTVIGFVLQGHADLGQRVVDSAVAQFPVVGDEISGTVSQSRLRGSGAALVVGLALTLWGGLGVAEAAQSAMNGIWNVPRRRYPSFLLRRLRGLAWLVILGGGLLLASVVSGVAAAADTAWSGPAGVAASTLVNMAAIAWALLQWLGGWYVARQLSRASATYGAFALVIGLLSWLYLASTVTLLAAELNVVRSRRLWPRSLAPPPLGGPDERALEGLAKQEERLPDQRVEVSFDGDAEAGGAAAGERPAGRGPPAQTG